MKKKAAWLCSFLLIFSVILGNVNMNASAQGTGTTFTINITDTSGISGNEVEYSFDNSTWNTAVSGSAIDIESQTGIFIKAVRSDTSAVLVSSTGTGFTTTDFGGISGDSGQFFSLDSGVSYVLDVTFSGNSSGGGGTPTFTNPKTISVAVSEGESLLDTFGNYIRIDGYDVTGGSVTVEQATSHTISVLCGMGYTIGGATVNGVNVSLTPDEFGAWYTGTVAEADSYDIKLTGGTDTSFYTIAWDNAGTLGSDATVKNGKVEIAEGAGITNMTQDPVKGGLYKVTPGTTVTIKLIPDYGYQLKTTDLNGATVAAGSEVSTFTFEMPSTNLHLAALFEKTEDVIVNNATGVSGVSITNGGNAASSGNLRMTVTDNSSYSTDVTTVVTDSKAEKVTSLDLSLENIVSKGNGNYWSNDVTEFTNPINVGLDLDLPALSEGETYSVVRDHNGTLTELNTSYDASTGSIIFETNQFSTYTIIKKTASKAQNITNASANDCNGNLVNSAVELADKVLTDAEKAAVSAGATANVWLEVKNSNGAVSDAEKALVEANKDRSSVVGIYLDINLYKQVGTGAATKVTDTNGAVTISLTMPENMLNKDSSRTRTYQIVRVHNNTVTVIDGNFDKSTGVLTFQTDAFSTYAITYKDTDNTVSNAGSGTTSNDGQSVTNSTQSTSDTSETITSPKTGDSSQIAIWVILMLVSGAGVLGIHRKKSMK